MNISIDKHYTNQTDKTLYTRFGVYVNEQTFGIHGCNEGIDASLTWGEISQEDLNMNVGTKLKIAGELLYLKYEKAHQEGCIAADNKKQSNYHTHLMEVGKKISFLKGVRIDHLSLKGMKCRVGANIQKKKANHIGDPPTPAKILEVIRAGKVRLVWKLSGDFFKLVEAKNDNDW